MAATSAPRKAPAKRTRKAVSKQPPTAAEAAFSEANPAKVNGLPKGKMLLKFRNVDFLVPTQESLVDDFRFRVAMKAGDDTDVLVSLVGNDVATNMYRLVDPEKDTFTSVIREFFTAYEKATGLGNS